MANERYDYTALRTVSYQGRPAYLEGQGVMAQVVEDLGLEIGVDVVPARPDVIPRPGDDAPRAEWAAFALGQGLDPGEVDDMTRDQLRGRYPADAPTEPPPQLVPAPDGATELGDLGDDVPDGTVEEVLAWVGDDQTRAVMVLHAEQAREKPRTGVTGPLEKMLDTEEG